MKLTAVVFLIVATILCPLAASAQGTASAITMNGPSQLQDILQRGGEGAYIVAGLLDLAITNPALRSGAFREANPVMAILLDDDDEYNTVFSVVKVGTTIALAGLMEWAYRLTRDDPKLRWIVTSFTLGAAAFQTWVVDRNIRLVFKIAQF